MKNILLVSVAALGLSSVALANGGMAPVATAEVTYDFTPGIYVGLQGGYADAGWSVFEDEVRISDDTGLAGRAFIGYDFHKYFAVEAGYFLVQPKTEIKYLDTKISDIRTQAIDLVGKIKAPITDAFGLYAKAGVGYLMTDGRNTTANDEWTTMKDNVDKFDLVYGFGAYYNFSCNWTVDAAFTRYNSGNSKFDREWQPDVDFYSLGLSYKFNLPV